MKKYLAFIPYFILTAFFFGACEKEINPDLPIPPEKIVVNAAFKEGENWGVSVTSSRFVLDRASIHALEKADVAIYEEGNLLEQLTFDQQTQRFLGESQARGEKEYSIKVSHPKYKTVEARTHLPKAAVIQDFAITPNARRDPNMYEGEQINRLQLTFKDMGGKQYYQVVLFQLRDGGELDEQMPHPVNDLYEKTYLETFDPMFLHDFGAPTFSNSGFEGRTQNVNVFFRTHDWERYFYNEESGTFEVDTAYTDQFLVYLLTLSPDYFDYYNSYQTHKMTEGDPFSEPAPVLGNVQNGFGIFAGYAFDSITFEFKP